MDAPGAGVFFYSGAAAVDTTLSVSLPLAHKFSNHSRKEVP
jgi:hypothetical protein